MSFVDFGIVGKDQSRMRMATGGSAYFPTYGDFDNVGTVAAKSGLGNTGGGSTLAEFAGDGAVTGGAGGEAPAAGSAGVMNSVGSLFSRAIVIILGFIFVAVGLSMFKAPAIITAATKIKG